LLCTTQLAGNKQGKSTQAQHPPEVTTGTPFPGQLHLSWREQLCRSPPPIHQAKLLDAPVPQITLLNLRTASSLALLGIPLMSIHSGREDQRQ